MRALRAFGARDLTDGFEKLSNVAYARLVGIVRTELHAPLPNGFTGNDDSSLSQQIFDVCKAQREPMVEPHGLADDLGWEAITTIA